MPPTFERRNPLTQEIASVTPDMDASQALTIAKHAQTAFASWSTSTPAARRTALLAAADGLKHRQQDFVQAMQSEIGATEPWALFNLGLAVKHVEEAAAMTTQITGETLLSDKPGCLSHTRRDPVGVILGIAPWNAPIILGCRAIAMPLACGNSVILKASEVCPRTHGLIAEAFQEAGFPAHTVNLVTHGPNKAEDIVNALIDAPEVRRINFTGSTEVGRKIAVRAAQQLKPVLLELGGKAPLLVLDDANIDEAVAAAAFGAMMNQGQICMSTERVIVTPAVADAFVEKLTAKVATLKTADPKLGQAPLGAVVSPSTVARCQVLIDDAVQRGADLLVSGDTQNAVLMPPHLLDKVTPEMSLYHTETFGPVLGVTRARDEEHAIALANDSDYGLSASVFTQDTARGLQIAQRIQAGMCHINGPTLHDEPQAPFGGVKASGYGRFGGQAGIDAFTELRWITVETEPGHYPF